MWCVQTVGAFASYYYIPSLQVVKTFKKYVPTCSLLLKNNLFFMKVFTLDLDN